MLIVGNWKIGNRNWVLIPLSGLVYLFYLQTSKLEYIRKTSWRILNKLSLWEFLIEVWAHASPCPHGCLHVVFCKYPHVGHVHSIFRKCQQVHKSTRDFQKVKYLDGFLNASCRTLKEALSKSKGRETDNCHTSNSMHFFASQRDRGTWCYVLAVSVRINHAAVALSWLVWYLQLIINFDLDLCGGHFLTETIDDTEACQDQICQESYHQ